MSAMLNYAKAQRDAARDTCVRVTATLEKLANELPPEVWGSLSLTQDDVLALLQEAKGPSAAAWAKKSLDKMNEKKGKAA